MFVPLPKNVRNIFIKFCAVFTIKLKKNREILKIVKNFLNIETNGEARKKNTK